MPQNEHIELFRKRYGKRLDAEERARKKARVTVYRVPACHGVGEETHRFAAPLYAKKRHKEKIEMKKTINSHAERNNKHAVEEKAAPGALPLMDRSKHRAGAVQR